MANPFLDKAGRFRVPTLAEAEALFWSRVAVGKPDECWPWDSPRSNGYGSFQVAGRSQGSHRWAVEFARGRPPKGLVRHSCDNPPCCNPAHLLEGTQLDNEHDKDERGRRPVGVKNLPCPKCGGPQEGRTKRKGANGAVREFAFCVPCRKKYMEAYYAERRETWHH